MNMPLAELLTPWVSRKLPDLPIGSLCIDSRDALPGSLFFALQGTTQDGRAYIANAIAKGAVAVVVDSDTSLPKQSLAVPLIPIHQLTQHVGSIAERFYQYPSESLTMYGVTGTNGKTSITAYIAQALMYLDNQAGVIGTTGNGLWPNLSESVLTTPNPIQLAALLADFVNQGAQVVAMEVSSHALAQYRADGIRFDTVIFTNLTRDHLDYHQTMQAYAQAKQRLFDFPDVRYRIFNTDDAMGQRLAKAYQGTTTYTYGLVDHPDSQHTYVTDIVYHADGIRATLHSPWYQGPVHLNLFGQFNVLNALAVFVALCVHAYPPTQVIAALATLHGAAGRMQCVRKPGAPLVVIDYAHTPDALANALQALRLHTHGKLWCVFGCGGDRDKGKRPLMAQIAEQGADAVIITSDNPRSEDPQTIINDIVAGLSTTAVVHQVVDRREAIHQALSLAKPEDTVLIAGKGHEAYQEIAGKRIPYQDLAVVEQFSRGCRQ